MNRTGRPQRAWPELDHRYVLSDHVFVTWRNRRAEICDAGSGAVLATRDVGIFGVLHSFAQPTRAAQVMKKLDATGERGLSAALRVLIQSGILRRTTETRQEPHDWDPPSLWFHRTSRKVHFRESRRGYDHPAVSDRDGQIVALRRGARRRSVSFTRVLDARSSRRTWSDAAISFKTLSEFYWLSARNRRRIPAENESSPTELVSRPYPSGGACYSLEVYHVVGANRVDGLRGGVYQYLPDKHAFALISDEARDFKPFLDAAGRSAGTGSVPTAIIVTARYGRQSGQYGPLAYSLILKEVGCLFQTFYCVAGYLGLAPCALGGGTPSELLGNLSGNSDLVEPVVGEFILGPG